MEEDNSRLIAGKDRLVGPLQEAPYLICFVNMISRSFPGLSLHSNRSVLNEFAKDINLRKNLLLNDLRYYPKKNYGKITKFQEKRLSPQIHKSGQPFRTANKALAARKRARIRKPQPGESLVIASQHSLSSLADRIERAYKRRHPNWLATGLTLGVWRVAATRLYEVAGNHESLPADPELFVAVQNFNTFRRDPWAELTQEEAVQTYQIAIRRIVRQLKKELTLEICWSTRYLKSTGSIDELISMPKSKISPIIKLLLCQQHGRLDLIALLQPAAEAQHLACPLYRIACEHLVPADCYPRPNHAMAASNAYQEQAYAWN